MSCWFASETGEFNCSDLLAIKIRPEMAAAIAVRFCRAVDASDEASNIPNPMAGTMTRGMRKRASMVAHRAQEHRLGRQRWSARQTFEESAAIDRFPTRASYPQPTRHVMLPSGPSDSLKTWWARARPDPSKRFERFALFAHLGTNGGLSARSAASYANMPCSTWPATANRAAVILCALGSVMSSLPAQQWARFGDPKQDPQTCPVQHPRHDAGIKAVPARAPLRMVLHFKTRGIY